MSGSREIRFRVGETSGTVSALLRRPARADCLLVLGHGAGAGMRHPFMEEVAGRLAERRIATLRYQFPYMERGIRRPSPQPVLLATVRAAVATATEIAPELPLSAGGKSMGGRMTSLAAARHGLEAVRGLVFFGFPLHPIGKPGVERADHLREVDRPMLFLQGTRDRLADLELLRPVCSALGAQASLHVLDGGDHSLKVLKRSGRTDDEVLDEAADTVRAWVRDSLTKAV